MALVLADRVQETTTTTGTGTVTLAGAVAGFQSFSVIGNGNTTYYTIVDSSTGDWEVGLGTYTSSGTTLSRTTVLSSSNSGSLVNFAAGTKTVFVTYPASSFGNVVGPASAGDNAFARFDGTTGKLIQGNTYASLSDAGAAIFGDSVSIQQGTGNDPYLELYSANVSGIKILRLKANSSQATSTNTYTFPTGYGSNGQVLTSNGSGGLSWSTASGGSGFSPVTAAMIFG
jgi:hypothetical protein